MATGDPLETMREVIPTALRRANFREEDIDTASAVVGRYIAGDLSFEEYERAIGAVFLAGSVRAGRARRTDKSA